MAFEVKLSNQYSTGFIVTIVEDKVDILKRNKLVYESSSVNDRTHIIKGGETIWQISLDFYEASKWYWVILDVNDIENPMELTKGIEILIPDLDLIKTLI